jgi:hypothetical protein
MSWKMILRPPLSLLNTAVPLFMKKNHRRHPVNPAHDDDSFLFVLVLVVPSQSPQLGRYAGHRGLGDRLGVNELHGGQYRSLVQVTGPLRVV